MTDMRKLVFDEGALLTGNVRMPAHASYSALNTFSTCPGMWVGGKVYKEPRRYGDPLTIGSIAHAALELAMRRPDELEPDWPALCREGIELERERNRLPENQWKGDPLPQDVVAPDGHVVTADEWADMAAERLRGFRLDLALNRPPTPAACEQRLETEVWGVPMVGSVDYRDRSGQIVDWKTGRLPAPTDDKAADHASQLRIYARMLETAGIRVTGARDVYVEHNTARTADLSDEQMELTGMWASVTWARMRGSVTAGRYGLTPSFLCSWCPLSKVCPKAMRIRGAKAADAYEIGLDWSDPDFDIQLGDAYRVQTKTGGNMSVLSLLDDMPQQTQPKAHMPAADPWNSEEGRKAAERWGFSDTTQLGGQSQSESQTVEPSDLRLVARKPYEPSLSEGHLNTAGYGFGQLQSMAAYAWGLDHDDPYGTLMLLLKGEWAAARNVWGAIVPDIPGLKDGRPDRQALLDWLDTSLARDADRIMRTIMDDRTKTDIGQAARDVAEIMTVTRRIVAGETK